MRNWYELTGYKKDIVFGEYDAAWAQNGDPTKALPNRTLQLPFDFQFQGKAYGCVIVHYLGAVYACVCGGRCVVKAKNSRLHAERNNTRQTGGGGHPRVCVRECVHVRM